MYQKVSTRASVAFPEDEINNFKCALKLNMPRIIQDDCETARWFELTVSLPAKWEQFLKHLAGDHEIDLNTIVGELCEWVFSDVESKEQFKVWLDEAYPPKGEAEDEARAAGEAAEKEEEHEEETEEETQDRTE